MDQSFRTSSCFSQSPVVLPESQSMEVDVRPAKWWRSENLAKAGATLLMLLLLAACAGWMSLMGEIADGLDRVIPSKEYLAPGTRYLLWRNAGLWHGLYPLLGVLAIWLTRRWERWLLLLLCGLCLHVMWSGFMDAAGAAALVPGAVKLH
jgi:hypothetical protein